jgi:hypothetical protein
MEKIIEKKGKYDADFNDIKWAISARSKDKTRANICCINIDGGCIATTDGHRLHVATTERDLDNGTYEVLKETKDMIVLRSTDFQFPDYERVFPKTTHNGIAPLQVKSTSDYDSRTQVLNHILKSADGCFNVDFLTDACQDGQSLYFQQTDGNGPLVIRNYDYSRAALIMPIRMS